jgi:hypothetical protein
MSDALLAILLTIRKPEPVRVCTEAPPAGEVCEGEEVQR